MYTVTKEKIDERPDLPDGNHKGSLIDIMDTVSKIKPDGSGGYRMFRFSWNILLGEHIFLLSDFILPEHPNEIVRKIARKKISLLGGILLNIKDGEEFDLYDCRYKQALLEVKSQIANDGNTYPRIISIKHLPLIASVINESHSAIDDFDVGDDEIPF
jgi:hypothetical protein